jgi:acyl-CoA reductase-like NAD-dependent aldehyde dehydrogenase
MNDMSALPRFTRPDFNQQFGQFIDGEWVEGATGETIALMNPATGEKLADIAKGDARDADRAVTAAHRAFGSWRESPPELRQELLLEIARRVEARRADYAVLETLNNGKPVMEAFMHDIPGVIELFRVHAGIAWDLGGTTIDRTNSVSLIHRQPLGVCAQIIPWNVPMLMMALKVAPALATGNTIVLKPSEIVSLSVMEFFREMADLIPRGVVNVLTGQGPDVGEALVTDHRVRKVSFTGSKRTARELMKYASVNIIPQSLELGGKSAVVICEDADLEAAAESCAASTVFNKGEVCVAGSRIFAHEKIREEFLDIYSAMLRSVRIGNPLDVHTQMGASASKMQMDKVLGYLDLGPKEGATLHLSGGRATGGELNQGMYLKPAIFTGVHNRMTIAREEIFGPVSLVYGWTDEQDVIEQANDTEFGLAAGVWTRDLGRAHRLTRNLEAGIVWVNRYFNFVGGASAGPFHGSGFGREFGREAALESYTHSKLVTINLDERPLGFFNWK